MEIIPAIDLIDGKSVRLQQGDYDKQVVMPMSAAEAVTYLLCFKTPVDNGNTVSE